MTLSGLVVCREQQTGRLRWRRKLPNQAWCRSALLCADGKVFVPRMFSLRYPKVQGQGNALYCLDGETGDILWEQPIGIGDRLRASPVFADGVVAFGSFYREEDLPRANRDSEVAGQAGEGWDAATGRRLWRVGFRSTGQCLNGPAGCAGDSVMFFAGGGESPRATGETMAISPQTGKILWRTSEAFASQTGTPSFQDGRSTCRVRTSCPWFAFPQQTAGSFGNKTKVGGTGSSIRFRWVPTTSQTRTSTKAERCGGIWRTARWLAPRTNAVRDRPPSRCPYMGAGSWRPLAGVPGCPARQWPRSVQGSYSVSSVPCSSWTASKNTVAS